MDSKRHLKQLTLNFAYNSPKKTSTCPECGLVFDPSRQQDKALHEKHHALDKADRQKVLNYGSTLFGNENLVNAYSDGKIIVISTDSCQKPALTKAIQVLTYVDEQLGIHETLHRAPALSKFYLFVSSLNKIEGFCLAEPVAEAFWSVECEGKLSYDETRPERGRHLCGISRIWVSEGARRRGIATRLLDCVCANFFYVLKVEPRWLAFSDPTQFGQALAKAYSKTQSFLVYNHCKRA